VPTHVSVLTPAPLPGPHLSYCRSPVAPPRWRWGYGAVRHASTWQHSGHKKTEAPKSSSFKVFLGWEHKHKTTNNDKEIEEKGTLKGKETGAAESRGLMVPWANSSVWSCLRQCLAHIHLTPRTSRNQKPTACLTMK
jgi:hypothetical protein